MEITNESEAEQMALRALMKRKELDAVNKQLEALRAAAAEFETREADIASMIEEAETEEERAAVEEEIESFESERNENAETISGLEETVRGIEAELEEIESEAPAPAPEQPEETNTETVEERGNNTMSKRDAFAAMTRDERTSMIEREDVKAFLADVRSMMKGEKRSISNLGLTVPDVFMGYIREKIEGYSKLYKYVNVKQISGDGTVVVMGTIPEAVWTDACGTINELSYGFNNAEIGCWKCGGFFSVCNAALEDSDLDLASELLDVIGQAIGYALDKAIVYGTGTRMPEGIVTRLAQTSAPADYPATARTWADLHTSNIKSIDATGVELFQTILTDSAAAKNKYSTAERIWVMNETTQTYLQAQAMSINAAGAVVSGFSGTMPVAGGPVVILDFIPDGDVITGYGDLYLLAERAGIKLAQSEHYRFLEDQTIFKGTARFDGKAVIAEGFAVMNVQGETPTTSMEFAPDTANESE